MHVLMKYFNVGSTEVQATQGLLFMCRRKLPKAGQRTPYPVDISCPDPSVDLEFLVPITRNPVKFGQAHPGRGTSQKVYVGG